MERGIQSVSLALLASGEVRGFFGSVLPPLADIQHERKGYDIATIRSGEVTASVLSVSLGAAVSLIAQDSLPLVMTAVISIGMVIAYERAIANPGTPAQPLAG
jgi:hypothetical protein